MNRKRDGNLVVCPRSGQLCSGLYFDCLRNCQQWVSERAARRRQSRIEDEQWVRARSVEFSEQMNSWKDGEPCPRCAATVAADKKDDHIRWHRRDDADLSP